MRSPTQQPHGMDWNNMFSANLNYQSRTTNTRPPSPPPSDHTDSMPSQHSMSSPSTANISPTGLIIRLLQEKDGLINEKNALLQEKDALVDDKNSLLEEKDQIVSRLFDDKHNLLKEKDDAMKHLVDEKVQLMATIQSLSISHYEQLREKDMEIFKLKEELTKKNEKCQGLARALQDYLDREALEEEDEEEEEERELAMKDVDMDLKERAVDPLDDVGLGRRFNDDRQPYKKRKLTLETQTPGLGPDVRSAVTCDVDHKQMQEKLAEAKKLNELRPKPATWATKAENIALSRTSAQAQSEGKKFSDIAGGDPSLDRHEVKPGDRMLALPQSTPAPPIATPLCASNLAKATSSKAEVITIPSDDETSDAGNQNGDAAHGEPVLSIERSLTPDLDIKPQSEPPTHEHEPAREVSEGSLRTLSSPPPDIAQDMLDHPTLPNHAYDELITFAAKAFPGQMFRPVESVKSDGTFELGRLIDVPSAVTESVQSSLEYYANRRRRCVNMNLPIEPASTNIKPCGHAWMSGCGSGTAWTATDPKKFACKTCFNRRRACLLWTGNHQWVVLPLPPDTRDPTATSKDDGFYVIAEGFKDRAKDFPGVWEESSQEITNKRKRSASAETQ